MCRLIAIKGDESLSPLVAINSLNAMKEGHDGSGVGIFITGLSYPFEGLKK